ncbi:MAG: hypothetical protein E7414_01035 [Ruminococcaceae bacterium]|nr:hypothetical protein [Oscillospiraceae bacterium]
MKPASREKLFWIIAAFLPYLLYGFQYYPILDDFIQYGTYPLHQDLSYVYLTIGTLSTRPLASLLDPTFWGFFWRVPGVALCLITGLHVASGFLLCDALRRMSLRPSPFFLLFFLLFPLGMEGRYWLSASTRLVPGLFFAALALFCLSRFMTEERKWGQFLLFVLFQLLSCGFYESVAVFSAASACLFFIWKPRVRHIPVPVISALNIGLMFAYYRCFANLGALGSRAAGLDLADLSQQLAELFRQLGEVAGLMYPATIIGSGRGIRLLLTEGWWGILLLIFMLLVSLCLSLSGRAQKNPIGVKKAVAFFVGGLALFFAPLVPNLLAEQVWLTNRSLFVSCIGLALFLEPLFMLLRGRLRVLVLFVCIFICLTATVNEYDVYRQVSLQDVRLVDQVAMQLDEDALRGRKPVQVVQTEPVETEQNALYKDHVKSVFDADWSLTGALRARLGSLAPTCLQPKLIGEAVEDTNCLVVYVN